MVQKKIDKEKSHLAVAFIFSHKRRLVFSNFDADIIFKGGII